jgi:hypothetical protein
MASSHFVFLHTRGREFWVFYFLSLEGMDKGGG